MENFRFKKESQSLFNRVKILEMQIKQHSILINKMLIEENCNLEDAIGIETEEKNDPEMIGFKNN